jgi:cation transport regulator ChaB
VLPSGRPASDTASEAGRREKLVVVRNFLALGFFMHKITLIGTVHEAEGACSFQNLYRIIEVLNPQIIFEELFPSDFNAYYKDKTKRRLETDVLNAYLEKHQVAHLPVDYDYNPPASFWKAHQQMHRRVEDNSFVYRNIIDQYIINKRSGGFKYLNSSNYESLNHELQVAIDDTLQKLNNEEFFQANTEWNDLMEKREHTMITNIYRYSKEHTYTQGLFYIGAAHRESIKKTIQIYNKKEDIKINWNCENYNEIL